MTLTAVCLRGEAAHREVRKQLSWAHGLESQLRGSKSRKCVCSWVSPINVALSYFLKKNTLLFQGGELERLSPFVRRGSVRDRADYADGGQRWFCWRLRLFFLSSIL